MNDRRIALVAFGVILDDIVFPDGRSVMGVLGGGGPQTAFGMRLWSQAAFVGPTVSLSSQAAFGGPTDSLSSDATTDRVGLAARINRADLGPIQEWLHACGIDTSGLQVNDLPTPRAWQLLEEDGRRTQLWRAPGTLMERQLRRALEDLPAEYRAARGFHFGIHPDEPDLDFIAALHAQGGLVSIEPFKPALEGHQPDPGKLRALLSCLDVFSANLLEAQSLVGSEAASKASHVGRTVSLSRDSSEARHVGRTVSLSQDGSEASHVGRTVSLSQDGSEANYVGRTVSLSQDGSEAAQVDATVVAERLLEAGAPCVVIRMGAAGSLVASQEVGHFVRLPAVPVQVVDPVGAGNAYCGAFLAGLVAGVDLATAGVWGAVAASFLVEQVGVPLVTPARQALALQRAHDLLSTIELLNN